jgi:hypothetical protein
MPFHKHYPWTRYWAPRDQMSLYSGSAFVPEPETLLGSGLPMYELSGLRDVPLLVLLGPPGQGKSTTIGDEVAALGAKGILTRRVDLLGVDSGVLLRDELAGAPEVQAWRDGAELHVFVDGLDRAQVELSTVQRVLTLALQGSGTEMSRLRLRIACRSADWEEGVAERLAEIWPARDHADEATPRHVVLELLNLTYAAFVVAARAHELDADAVAAEVAGKGAEPLAAVPVTLMMILDAFSDDGVLGTRTELYRHACRKLVMEGPLPSGTRGVDALALAARQAAALMLCDAAALTAGETSTRSEITIYDLAGGTEPPFLAGPDEPSVVVKGRLLLDVHSTGLMRKSSGGAVFFHQTVAEYLCAAWLASGRLARQQVDALLVNPHDGRRQLLPHLKDVAGWLAALDPAAFKSLIKTQARVLLRGDLALLEPEARRDLIAALLVPDESERIWAWDRQIRDSFRRLGHPGIAEQLRPFVRDVNADEEVRVLAIALAEANHVTALIDDLLAVALDPQAAVSSRRIAVEAVGAIGDDVARRGLLPLALEAQGEDWTDEVKGAALSMTWPDLVDTITLLTALTPAKRPNYFGNYQLFLTRAAALIPSKDLVAAVDWVTAQPLAARQAPAVSEFAHGVIERAWTEVDRADVADALSRFAAVCLERDRELVGWRRGQGAFDEQAGRRAIVVRLIHRVGEDGIHPRYLSFSRPALIRYGDVDWLCDALGDEPDPAIRVRWAQLIDAVFVPEHSPVDRVLETVEEFPELADVLRFWIRRVVLDSEEARVHQQRYAEVNAIEEEDEDSKDRERIDVDVEIQTLLDAGEAGDRDAWWRICSLVIFDARGRQQVAESSARIAGSPAWSRADPATRERLLGLAEQHILTRDGEPDKWVDKAHGWRPARAGAQALMLLEEQRHADWLALEPHRWEAWAPAIVGFPQTDSEGAKPVATMMRRLRQVAPVALVRWAVTFIRQAEAGAVTSFIGSRLSPVLDLPELQSAVLDMVGDEALGTELRVRLTTAALDEGFGTEVALTLLTNAVQGLDDGDGGSIDLARELMSTMLRHAPVPAWPVAWLVFREHPALGREVIERLVAYESFGVAASLEEQQVADLYLWLDEQYPRAEDPDDADGVVSTRQQVAWWRDRLIEVLMQRRTPAGVEALRRLHAARPEIPFLAGRLRMAEIALAEALWTPPRPRQLVQLAEDRTRRLVQSTEQLQAVVLESLARANECLQGEWPKAWQLWNDDPFQPKSEERLSDWLKDWLDGDLARRIVTTREPQVRPTRSGKGIGARNDLRVELGADADADRGPLAVIIEVKRCWHRKIFTAARTQLADDYLASAGLSHGIYLVGYYDAPGWSGPGSAVARRRDLSGWRARIADVAAAASKGTGRTIAPVVLDVSLQSDRAS